jgi:hypothetical protein
MPFPDEEHLPRDPQRLIKEVDAAIKLRDIENLQRCRDSLEFKWWEGAIVVVLFISGLGFVMTIYKLIPATSSLLFWFVFFWFIVFTCTLIAAVEFLLAKINALRRLCEILFRSIERLEKDLGTPRQETPASPQHPER